MPKRTLAELAEEEQYPEVALKELKTPGVQACTKRGHVVGHLVYANQPDVTEEYLVFTGDGQFHPFRDRDKAERALKAYALSARVPLAHADAPAKPKPRVEKKPAIVRDEPEQDFYPANPKTPVLASV